MDKAKCEHINEIPLIIFTARKLQFDVVINRYLQHHGNIRGIGYGELTIGWLAFILTQCNHRKSHVEKWALARPLSLKALLSNKIRDKDFSDDRLSKLLNLLGDDDSWNAIEKDLWQAKMDVYDLPLKSIRLDSTSVYGYHEQCESDLMQYGFSKDDKHHLPQLKLMAGVEGAYGGMIAVDVVPGNKNDDVLYLPLIKRMKRMVLRKGLLYCGDSKMSSLNIRAYLDREGDYYLAPLQKIKGRTTEFNKWIQQIVSGEKTATLVWNGKKLRGGGYEFTNNIQYRSGEENYVWKERVIVFRSLDLAKTQIDGLEKRLKKAEEKLKALTVQEKGRKSKNLDKLKEKVEKILEGQEVKDLFTITWKEIEGSVKYERTEIRNGKARNGAYTIKKSNYGIDSILRNTEAIEQIHRDCGWRIYVTNTKSMDLPLDMAIAFYREGWKIERVFHFLKSHPIQIRPLYVYKDKQMVGLCRLLTIGLRLVSHIEMAVQREIDKQGKAIQGVYKGQPRKKTNTPSMALIAQTFENISLMIGGEGNCSITPPQESAEFFLRCLGLDNVFKNMLESVLKFI